jgi:integrase
MSIQDFVEKYIAARDVSKTYVYRLRKVATKLTTFLGTSDVAEIFVEDNVNRFLASLTDASPFTVRSYRSDVLSLWNAAADHDLVAYPRMRRIRRAKCPQQVIECFSVDEVKALLAALPTVSGGHPLSNGVDRAVFWNAIIRLAWDTGLRRGDCWEFRKSWIRPDGTARVTQRKTRQVVTVRLHKSTVEALDAIPFDKATHWPGKVSNSSRFCSQFRCLLRRAGIRHGSFKWLRRASGSYVDAELPGAGYKHLGQSGQQVFKQHYDAGLAGHVGPMPPELGDGVPLPNVDGIGDEFLFL